MAKLAARTPLKMTVASHGQCKIKGTDSIVNASHEKSINVTGNF